MKVCHITSMHDWDDDRIYQRACLGLARSGFDVHLVATQASKFPPDSPVRFHPVTPRRGWRRRWFSSREAVQLAARIEADVYHFHDPDILPHAMYLKRRVPKAKVVYDIHENYASRVTNWGLPKSFGRLIRFIERKALERMDGFCVVSSEMFKLFSDVSVPGIVVRNSVDVSRLQSLNLERCKPFSVPTVYTSGTNSNDRHCLETVRALKYIVEENRNCRMLFVGRYRDEIDREMYSQAEADKTLDFLALEGMLPWEDNFYRTARAFCGCVFYADTSNNSVGLPNRLFEYMFCGIPVVVSDFPALVDVVKDLECGVVVNSREPQSIADGILTLLRDPNAAREMGARGKAGVEGKYGFHKDLALLIEFYGRI